MNQESLRWLIATICNATVVIWMLTILLKTGKSGSFYRFFTTLSNLFAMAGCALILPFCVAAACTGKASVPDFVLLFKYVSTVSVCVTWLTVMFFLGPTQGYRKMFEKNGLYLHLIGPILCVGSCCFAERAVPSLPAALLGLIPTVLYGTVYYIEVIVKKHWEDFYGFDRGGNHYLSAAAMVLGTAAICVLLSVITH